MAEFQPAGSEYGWRRRPLAGALRLRPPVAQASPGERELLRRHAAGAQVAVEIGVAEGGSAAAILEVIDPEGTLYLLDPFPSGRLGISLERLTARRAVAKVSGGRAVWVRRPSGEVVKGWDLPIDFLFIDGDNTFAGVARDWTDWSPHVREGGVVVLQGTRNTEDNWVEGDYGPAKLFREEILDDPDWTAFDGADAAMAVRRVGPAPVTGRFAREEGDRRARQGFDAPC